jgi:trans-aconitate methyltransferase
MKTELNERLRSIRNEWDSRAEKMGVNIESVLFKRFPNRLNNYIHNRHKCFILNCIDINLTNLLDAGCGYGRLSREILEKFPKAKATGIDISKIFVDLYNQYVGNASCMSLESYQPSEQYTIVIAVTILMYLETELLDDILKRLWAAVSPGGWFFVIEPAIEFQLLYRLLSGNKNAGSTGGDVKYFTRHTLTHLLNNLNSLKEIKYQAVSLIPGIKSLNLHHMFALKKNEH